jgi:hypothetical protein
MNMSSASSRYRINEPSVIGEILEGELVLVHFESGCYYSIRGTGSDVWNLAISGHTAGEIAEKLAAHHRLPVAEIAAGVGPFVAQLVAEQLLAPASAAGACASAAKLSTGAYVQPAIEKYDDLAGQLLLDPIHEIDQSGWPAAKAA